MLVRGEGEREGGRRNVVVSANVGDAVRHAVDESRVEDGVEGVVDLSSESSR